LPILRKNTLERDELLADRAQAAERLEQQVKERTAELAQSVEELRALGDVSQAVNSSTRALAGNTSILMRPLVASPMVCASRRALGSKPGMVSVRSVTIVSCRVPWAMAGAGKPEDAPAASAVPAPARTSRRLMAVTLRRISIKRGGR
jgi:hypothetical protein